MSNARRANDLTWRHARRPGVDLALAAGAALLLLASSAPAAAGFAEVAGAVGADGAVSSASAVSAAEAASAAETEPRSAKSTKTVSTRITGAVHRRVPEGKTPGPDGRCPDGREPVGDLGIKSLKFEGSMQMQDGEILSMSFRSEPVVLRIDEGGPADGRLHEGDVIVSLGGKLITTSAAGRIYAQPPIGEPLAVVVRRGGQERTVTIVPTATCPDRSEEALEALEVLEAPPAPEGAPIPEVLAPPPEPGRFSAPRAPRAPASPRAPRTATERAERDAARAERDAQRALREQERIAASREHAIQEHAEAVSRHRDAVREYERAVARAWVEDATAAYTGLGLSADELQIQAALEGGDDVIVFVTPPEVFSVDEDSPAERAGLRRGDVIVAVGDVDITTRQGSERLAKLEPGRAENLTVLREGRLVSAPLVPEKRRGAARLGQPVYRLRYAGEVGGVEVQVHGLDDAKVGVEERSGQITIETEEATITVRLQRDR